MDYGSTQIFADWKEARRKRRCGQTGKAYPLTTISFLAMFAVPLLGLWS